MPAYRVRINPKNYNPLTKAANPNKYWEVSQMANKDSEQVTWLCGDIRVSGVPIQTLFESAAVDGFRRKGAVAPIELIFHGVILRGHDNAIEINERTTDYEVR
jgi:hypothetical protein